MKNLKETVGKICILDKDERKSFIETEVSKLGYIPRSQNFGDGCNIIVEKKGNLSKKIIISAHYDDYDGKEVGGAYDNAGGTIVLLGIMDQLRNHKTMCTIQFIFFDEEEKGQRGSKYFLENLTKEKQEEIIYNLNIDGAGIGNILTKSNQFKIKASRTDSSSFIEYGISSKHYFTVSDEDFKILKNGKLPTLAKKLHTPQDNVRIIKEQSLENAINSILRIIKIKDREVLK